LHEFHLHRYQAAIHQQTPSWRNDLQNPNLIVGNYLTMILGMEQFDLLWHEESLFL
jgi:hypothetical protein